MAAPSWCLPIMPAAHPAVGADGQGVIYVHDARFHRARRGRTDAPAGRASGNAAGDAQHQRLPARRHHRDGGMLGTGARDRRRRAFWRCRVRACRCCARPGRPRTCRRAAAMCCINLSRRAMSRCLRPARKSRSRKAAEQLLDRKNIKRRSRFDAVLGEVRGAGQGYRDEVLGKAPRIAVEAAARLGWDRWIGPDGAFIGMDGFGARAGCRSLPSISASPPNGSSPG
jgi:hypothetical protein